MNSSTDAGCVITPQGILQRVSAASRAALGYDSAARLEGRPVAGFVHPDDWPRVQAGWRRQGAVTLPEFRVRAANGEWKWFETTITNQMHNPAIVAYTASSRDITERKKHDFELAESEQRLRLLFEHNPALAVFLTTGGQILDANPAFLAFFKKQKREVVQQQLVDFLPLELRPLFGQHLQDAAAGRRGKFVATVPAENGELRTLTVQHLPLVVEGEIVGVHVMAKDITEIFTAHRLIERQAAQLTSILESITDAFFSLDTSWNLTYVNREAERLFDMTRGQCVGKNLWDLFPESEPIFYEMYQQALQTGKTVRFQFRDEKQGLWLDFKVFPSPEGLAVYFADVTEQVQAARQLERLALVARGTDNAVIITDVQGRTEWVNEGFTKHTGYALADLLGKTPGQVLQGPETEPATIGRIRERMTQGRAFAATVLNYKKTGEKLWFYMDITPIYNERQELTQFIAIQQNITYRKEIEASQAKMTQDLYRQNRDLQQFNYIISHNLRAPLANALGLAKLLTKVDKQGEVFDTSLAHLRKSVAEVDTVLKDLNTVLSIRDQPDVLPPEPVALSEVCREVALNLDKPLRQCGGQVQATLDADVVVRGNRAYLYSIFYNLLSNSIKYRAEERALLVEIKCFPGPHGGPTISFTDNGSGFDMFKAGSDIFQLYKRFHTNQRGRGIGLFLVKAHVEAMGGKIEVASGVNFGTRFLIHLDPR